MIYQCPHCSRPIAADANFCSSCGGRLTLAANSPSIPDGSQSSDARGEVAAALAAGVIAIALAVAFLSSAVNNLLHNPSLEEGTESELSCWTLGGFGANDFTWNRTSDAHAGMYALQLDVRSHATGDRKLVTTQDDGACAPTVNAGQVYTATAWYKATHQPLLFVYYRDSGGEWVYWTTSPELPTSSAWTQASLTTPAVPEGATNISIGLGLAGVGSVTIDDFELIAAD